VFATIHVDDIAVISTRVVALLWNLARTGMNSTNNALRGKADGDSGHPPEQLLRPKPTDANIK
jgi:hypothetical protein